MGKKKIETLIIEVQSTTGIKFEDLLLSNEFDGKEKYIYGKDVALRVLDVDKTNNTITGIIETSRKSNVPAKKNAKSKKISKLGLEASESLVYANIFIYDLSRKLIMYEVNKNGCFIDHFIEYFYRCSRDKESTIKDFGLKFNSLLKKDEYLRLKRFDYIKSLQIEVAHPKELELELKDETGAMSQMVSVASSLGFTQVSAKFNVTSREPSEGVLSKSFDDFIQKSKKLLSSESSQNVKKIIICGYDIDGESPNKLEPIDLVADRYLRTIDLNEPRENSDLLESQRTLAIKSLHLECCDDFNQIFKKNE